MGPISGGPKEVEPEEAQAVAISSKKSLIASHIQSHHKEEMEAAMARGVEGKEGAKANACEECGAAFKKPAYLKQHMQGHSLEVYRALSVCLTGVLLLFLIVRRESKYLENFSRVSIRLHLSLRWSTVRYSLWSGEVLIAVAPVLLSR
ncbi:hypothetical protein NL676_018628 [Syzygium grande]|nr:hypothetical protein NL676_018628 [Syzygium grande]